MATVPNSSSRPAATTTRRPRPGSSAVAAKRNSGGMLISFGLPFDRTMLFGILGGVVVIALGFFLMSTAISSDVAHNDGVWNNTAAVTIAPIVLTIGYCVIVPWAIASRRRRLDGDAPAEDQVA